VPTDSNLTDTAPPDRFCDLVMKGGITSGVVYPLAILELAKSYRFKNIGGTSAGAIAAVVTAAAEYRRRHGSMAGFERLQELPVSLGDTVGGHSRLLSLFQPSASTRRLFTALLSTLNRDSTFTRWLGGVIGFLRAYWWWVIAGVIAALLIDLGVSWILKPQGMLGIVLLATLGAIAGVLIGIYRDVTRGLVPNGFGLCKCGPGGAPAPALVPWLHDLIQTTAGRGAGMPPLTFSDLWAAPGFPPPCLESVAVPPVRSINLQVFTTNLTHGRPYHLPLEDETSRLFFKAKELQDYFPADVIEYMVAHSNPYQKRSPVSDPEPARVDADLREMPCGELPIIVAARLSLSFPILISAVPLWAIDYEAEREDRTIRKCWFSDGGICSNFPIHLFDGFLPMWPTFGITLGERKAFRPDVSTWLPQRHEQGRADSWNRFSDKPDAIGQLGGFLASIVTSAQNWNDATGTRMPGVRDRVVHVRLRDGEGGLNLNMPKPLITTLAEYGRDAGNKLRTKFSPVGGTEAVTPGWREHRWVRFNVTLAGIRDRLRALRFSAASAPHTVSLHDQIREATCAAPLSGQGERPLTTEQADALQRLLTALTDAEVAFSLAKEPQPYKPVPEPSIRVRPPL
jgi:predicted acylesterase/phospholipase RssA